ncbi:cytochrome b/b6 domain-containing protein [Caballeronia sp. LZ035]|uniref:cytochrome b/b6 domain-containing protein n=1 Tax=Caballeronia sp. LZ035 TaxID=3038568 RepID=UPI00285825D8|nr:cytochrome b/b6 domain-containing protein [Caballeronia sp. LZ035]MDR5755481.1 cytochrome b/b6 domain-containing protein [Caballeronia sp. LZ035]
MTRPTKVWDIWVRLTHWAVAGIVLWNLFGPTDSTHRLLGYGAAGLVAARFVWGFIGSRHARFSAWWPTRTHLVEYLRSLAAGQPMHHLSHNPLGALMALTLWCLVLALALSGWIMRLDAFWGEDWPQEIHSWLAVAIEVCVCVHVLAAVLMSVWTRENLIGAMLTGNKRSNKRGPEKEKAP